MLTINQSINQVEEVSHMGDLHIATALVKSPLGMMVQPGSGSGSGSGAAGGQLISQLVN